MNMVYTALKFYMAGLAQLNLEKQVIYSLPPKKPTVKSWPIKHNRTIPQINNKRANGNTESAGGNLRELAREAVAPGG
jgi:hypothetical protein